MMDSSLSDIATIFGQSFGIHRVNVVGEDGRVKGVISQSDIARFLLSKVWKNRFIFMFTLYLERATLISVRKET